MNENLRTPKKPARTTALLLIGIAMMGTIAAMPTAAALGTPPDEPCYEDYVMALTGYHPCGACRSGETQYYTYPAAGTTVSVGGQKVYVPMFIWWDKCTDKPGTDLAGQPVEEASLPTGG